MKIMMKIVIGLILTALFVWIYGHLSISDQVGFNINFVSEVIIFVVVYFLIDPIRDFFRKFFDAKKQLKTHKEPDEIVSTTKVLKIKDLYKKWLQSRNYEDFIEAVIYFRIAYDHNYLDRETTEILYAGKELDIQKIERIFGLMMDEEKR